MFLVWSTRKLKTVTLKALKLAKLLYWLDHYIWKIVKHSLNNVVANLHEYCKAGKSCKLFIVEAKGILEFQRMLNV